MPDVRATFEPDKVLSVTDREAYDLRQQGLLVDENDAPDRDPATPDAPDAAEHHEQTQAERREAIEQGTDDSKGRRGTARAKD